MSSNSGVLVEAGARRTGDDVRIGGDYQARALVSERLTQRMWHEAKFRLIDRVAAPTGGMRVADVGCGSGTIADYLARTAGDVVAVDSNPEAIAYGSTAFQRPNLHFVLGQFERLRESAPFDGLYCVEVLEHLYYNQALETLRLFHDVAKPNGRLFATTPNYLSLWPVIEWSLDRLQLVPQLAGDQHVSKFTKRRLADACSSAGWRVEEIGTFNGFAPFVAPLSYSLARQMERVEMGLRTLLPMNILYCVCRKVS